MDESAFREKLSIDFKEGGSGEMSESAMTIGIDATLETFRGHCGRLEGFLREGQDIRWEYAIKDVETSLPNICMGIVQDRAIETELLIGADGIHSQVRKSLAPDFRLKVLPYVIFNGNRKISLGTYKSKLQPELQKSCIVQSRVDDVILQISIIDFSAHDVSISYTYSRPARQNDPLHKPDRPVPGATDIPEAFYEELGTLNDLGQAYAEIFDPEKVRGDRVLHWLMRSTLGSEQDIKGLADRGVSLLGDAIHAMPILGGEGGNNAMKDGVDLAEHIASHGLQGIRTFSAGRHEKWRKGVEESEQRLAEMHISVKASL